MRFDTVDQFDCHPLRYLRQQAPYVPTHKFILARLTVHELRANRMRLPELDEKPVEIHPLPISLLVPGVNVAGGEVNEDLLEISMVGCNRLERHSDPHDV